MVYGELKAKRKKRKLETIDELVTELQSADQDEQGDQAEETIAEQGKPCKKTDEEQVDYFRDELIKASEDGIITQKVEYLKKSSSRVINKIYKQLEAKRKREANEFLTDLTISNFSSMLGGLDAIENPKVLTDELKKNSILKKDVENIVSFVAPYIPLIGLIGGIAIIGKHIYMYKTSTGKNEQGDQGENSLVPKALNTNLGHTR